MTTAPDGSRLADDLARLAKALGHPARVRILQLLLERDWCFCGEIVEQVPLAQATVSQHLKVLRDAGLIEGEIDGPRTCYCANRERLSRLRDLLGAILADAVELEDDGRGCRCTRPPPSGAGPEAPRAGVVSRLSTLDRFLPLWIALAMAAGLALGSLLPSLNDWLGKLQVGTVSLPIAAGLLLMMYPVLAKVRYEELGSARADGVSDRRFFGVSLFLSWVVGPLLMFALAWIFLSDQPAYRTGVIIVGLARCIAMVLVWNEIARGDRDRAAVLVVFNAIFQLAAYSLLGYFYLTVLPGWLGLETQGFQPGIWEIARTVLIFLGIPLTAGYLTRRIGLRRRGRDWYEQTLHPEDRSDHALRAAVHDRAAVRDPGRQDHVRAAGRRPDRAAAAGVLRRHVGRRIRRRQDRCASPTRRPRASRSPSPPTTSSSRSRSPSASSAPRPARRWPASSAR